MNLSIFIMYSPDRKEQLEQMIRLNSRLEGWSDCQKIILVDGEPNCFPEGFEVFSVERPNSQFNWSSMWEAGVEKSIHEKLLYLDSDRVFGDGYLVEMENSISENSFTFTESLFSFKAPEIDEFVGSFLGLTSEEIRTRFDEWKDRIFYDPRYALPLHGPGKGVMSGSVGFTKQGYVRSGGVDPWFEGHGAYADTDYQKQVCEAGYRMVSIETPEFHLWHPKLSDGGNELKMKEIELLSLNNFVYHAKKWRLGYEYPKAIAAYLKLPNDFVDQVLRRLEVGDTFSPLTPEIE